MIQILSEVKKHSWHTNKKIPEKKFRLWCGQARARALQIAKRSSKSPSNSLPFPQKWFVSSELCYQKIANIRHPSIPPSLLSKLEIMTTPIKYINDSCFSIISPYYGIRRWKLYYRSISMCDLLPKCQTNVEFMFSLEKLA